MPILREATGVDFEWAQAQFAANGMAPSDPSMGPTFVFVEGETRLGTGRFLFFEDGAVEVGGLTVVESHRGQGLGRALVEALLGRCRPHWEVFGVAFAHLVEFYQTFGFRPIDPSEGPESLREEVEWCRCNVTTPVVLMRWERGD